MAKQAIEPTNVAPVAIPSYRARRDFTFKGVEVRRGDLVPIDDTQKARGMISARFVADPLGVA